MLKNTGDTETVVTPGAPDAPKSSPPPPGSPSPDPSPVGRGVDSKEWRFSDEEWHFSRKEWHFSRKEWHFSRKEWRFRFQFSREFKAKVAL